MAETKKYFWLRLKRDFFKRHDIQIIEAMPNGKDYILFYLKLLCESVDHEGKLRFSEQIPYNEEMLATITRTNVDIVRSAIKVFSGLNMMDLLDDGTLYMKETEKMLGFETEWAQKKREYRKALEDKSRTKKDNVRQEIELEKEIEIEIDKKEKDKKKKSTPAPAKTSFGEFGHVKLSEAELVKLIDTYGKDMTDACITFLDEYIEDKGYKSKSHYMTMRRWVVDAVREREQKHQKAGAKENLEQSYEMLSKWAGGEK